MVKSYDFTTAIYTGEESGAEELFHRRLTQGLLKFGPSNQRMSTKIDIIEGLFLGLCLKWRNLSSFLYKRGFVQRVCRNFCQKGTVKVKVCLIYLLKMYKYTYIKVYLNWKNGPKKDIF